MDKIIKTKLRPERNPNTVLYPETSADQIPDLISFLTSKGITNGKGGIKSITSDGVEVVGDRTQTTIAVDYQDNTTQYFVIYAENGKDGESITEISTQGSRDDNGYTETEIDFVFNNGDRKTATVLAKNGATGNSISSIHTIGHTVVGNETITTVQVTFTDVGSPTQNFEIHAQNGSSDVALYKHSIICNDEDGMSVTIYALSILPLSFTTTSFTNHFKNGNVLGFTINNLGTRYFTIECADNVLAFIGYDNDYKVVRQELELVNDVVTPL